MSNIIIALGGNVGHVRKSFECALTMLHQSCHIIAKSRLYQTPALVLPGADPQPDYVNAAVHVVSTLPPTLLLTELHRIEAALGRERKTRWGARTIDLDLIDYEGIISTSPALMLPHPELAKRLFVLQPLHDIIPNWIHPITNLSVSEMIAALEKAGETKPQGEAW